MRADRWLSQFPVEKQPPPTSGRRIQIVVTAPMIHSATPSSPRSLTINGQQCMNLSADDGADLTYLDWCRAHLNAVTGQIWVSFHTRNAEWSQGALSLSADLDGSRAFDATAVAVRLPLVLSYVTTAFNGTQVILHVHSESSSSAVVTGLTLDGVGIHEENVTIPAGGHGIFVAKARQQKLRGDVWTAVLFVDGSEAGAAYGGRTVGERWVTEAWPKSTDCPLPRSSAPQDPNATEVEALGIDSLFCGVNC
eukprot:SAG31_NODE_14104_length_827_cov_0.923077_1_plen_250_part_10